MSETTEIVIPPSELPASPLAVEQAVEQAAATEAAAETAQAAAEMATDAADLAAQSAQSAQSALESSSNASAASDLADLSTQNKLLRENLDLIFRRLDQLANVLSGALAPFQTATDEIDTTAELMQQVISRADEQQEQLGVGLAALAKVTMELTAGLAQVATLPKAERTSK